MMMDFCPTDYFVPYEPEKGLNGQIGFVAGCHWGDDLDGPKIQMLDLSEIEKGIIRREPRFGRIFLPNGVSLQQAIDLDSYDTEDKLVWIATAQPFDLK